TGFVGHGRAMARWRPHYASSILTPLCDCVSSSCRQHRRACSGGRPMPKPLNEPLGVVAGDELADDPARLGEILEAIEIEALLLERAHEALDDAVALRSADVRRRNRHPQPLHLVDPRIGDVLRAPVAPDPESARDVLRKPTEDVPYALPQRLECSPAIADLGGVPADELVDAVI